MSTLNPKVFVNDRVPTTRKDPPIGRVEGNLGEFWSMLSKRVPCEQCGAEADAHCVSISEAKPGAELDGYHRARFLLAKTKYGRKS